MKNVSPVPKSVFILLLTLLTIASPVLGQKQEKLMKKNTIQNDVSSSQQGNHLVYEKSPYLLQHAYNPVDWYPWGDKALAKAKAEDKPIFLSIGYSTCHWCHVMAHESFENQEIADFLNANFISIKVDREERPGIDQIYMAATPGNDWKRRLAHVAVSVPGWGNHFMQEHIFLLRQGTAGRDLLKFCSPLRPPG